MSEELVTGMPTAFGGIPVTYVKGLDVANRPHHWWVGPAPRYFWINANRMMGGRSPTQFKRLMDRARRRRESRKNIYREMVKINRWGAP